MRKRHIPAFVLLALLTGPAWAGQSKHRITVTFNYDFTHQAACQPDAKSHGGEKGDKKCVQEFVVFDISAGEAKRTKLLSIPVPKRPHGMMKGITGTTPLLLFESGRHLIAVVARTQSGLESGLNQCTVWVDIPD